jgi:hypothetical protein
MRVHNALCVCIHVHTFPPVSLTRVSKHTHTHANTHTHTHTHTHTRQDATAITEFASRTFFRHYLLYKFFTTDMRRHYLTQ